MSYWRSDGVGRSAPGSKNGGKGGKSGDDQGDIRHLTTFWGRQNCSPPRAPIAHATPLCSTLVEMGRGELSGRRRYPGDMSRG